MALAPPAGSNEDSGSLKQEVRHRARQAGIFSKGLLGLARKVPFLRLLGLPSGAGLTKTETLGGVKSPGWPPYSHGLAGPQHTTCSLVLGFEALPRGYWPSQFMADGGSASP